MPISVSTIDDNFEKAIQYQRKFGWVQTIFDDFANAAIDTFSQKDPMRLGLHVTASVGQAGSDFTLVFCGRTVRFSLLPVPGGKDYTASIFVHLMPTHAEFEAPVQLGDIRVQGDGTTNIEVNGLSCSLRSREGALAILLHFIVQASSSGFCSK